MRARGVVTSATSGSWELKLETVHGARTWQRSLRASSCEELADAGALIIALVVDPTLQPDPAPHKPPAQPPEPSRANSRSSNATPPSPVRTPASPGRAGERTQEDAGAAVGAPLDRPQAIAPDRRSGVAGHAALSGVADVGSLPKTALGLQVAAGLRIEPLELEIVGNFFPEAREVIANEPERGGEISLLAAGVRGCYVRDWETLGAGACGGFEAGRMQGTGFGASSWTDTRSSLFTAARVGAFVRYPLLSLSSIRAGLEGLIPVTRPEFVLDNVGSVHRPAAAIVRLELGLALVFR